MKIKLFLTALMACNLVTTVHTEPARYAKKRPSIVQRIKRSVSNAWNNTDPLIKQTVFGIGTSVAVLLITQEIQKAFTANEVAKKIHIVNPKNITTTFDDIIGHDIEKKIIKSHIAYQKNPQLYKDLGAKPEQAILMWGPGGTGKTELAKAAAKEAGFDQFLQVNGQDGNGKWRGDGTELFNQIVALCSKGPTALFMDEIDAIIRNSDGGNSSNDHLATINSLKTFLEGFEKPKYPLLVLAGMNSHPADCDKALLRRFKPVYVGPSSQDEFTAIGNKKLSKIKKVAPSTDFSPVTALFSENNITLTGDKAEKIISAAGIEAAETGLPYQTKDGLERAARNYIESYKEEQRVQELYDVEKKLGLMRKYG